MSLGTSFIDLPVVVGGRNFRNSFTSIGFLVGDGNRGESVTDIVLTVAGQGTADYSLFYETPAVGHVVGGTRIAGLLAQLVLMIAASGRIVAAENHPSGPETGANWTTLAGNSKRFEKLPSVFIQFSERPSAILCGESRQPQADGPQAARLSQSQPRIKYATESLLSRSVVMVPRARLTSELPLDVGFLIHRLLSPMKLSL
jgi:hypothetical protein